MRFLAPLEPEPPHDWEYLRACRETGDLPLIYFWRFSVKWVDWRRGQRFFSRLRRGIFGE